MGKKATVNLGDIFLVPLDERDEITPKDGLDHRNKYCLVVGFLEYGYYVVYFILNSDPNPNFINTHERLSCQYPLSYKDYPHLIRPNKDPSYLDLGHIRKIEKQRLIDEGKLCGTLTASDYKNIFEWLIEGDYYPPKTKKKHGWIR